MNDKAEKVYGEAFFSLCMEDAPEKVTDILEELNALDGIFRENAEFVKLMGTPTVSVDEKIAFIDELCKAGGVSELCRNLMCLLAERSRFGCFEGVVKNFRDMYNLQFGIAEITVTTKSPLSEKARAEIIAKMSSITGKKISIREKLDADIIGGIIIDYGSTRYDGSVKSRLNALKNELGSVIA